jgi:hypothetical protein
MPFFSPPPTTSARLYRAWLWSTSLHHAHHWPALTTPVVGPHRAHHRRPIPTAPATSPTALAASWPPPCPPLADHHHARRMVVPSSSLLSPGTTPVGPHWPPPAAPAAQGPHLEDKRRKGRTELQRERGREYFQLPRPWIAPFTGFCVVFWGGAFFSIVWQNSSKNGSPSCAKWTLCGV